MKMTLFPIPTLSVIFSIFTFIVPVQSLECYDCEPCNDIGQKVTCAVNQLNCLVAFGYLDNLVGIKKGCTALQPNSFGAPFCQGFLSQQIYGYTFLNSTGCICGIDGCNDKILPTGFQYINQLKFAEYMKANKKCFQCDPCVNEGVEVLCADGVVNCFQATGDLNGAKTLVKGCESPSAIAQGPLKCANEDSLLVFNKTLSKATYCLCSGNNCNVKKPGDVDVVVALDCFTCNGKCSGGGVMSKCLSTDLNCFIGQGTEKDTGANVTIRGCADTNLIPLKLPGKKCTDYQEYIVSSKTYTNIAFCGCSENGCNNDLAINPVAPNLKCQQCNPCVQNVSATACAKESSNCFVATGMKDGSTRTMKGCVGIDLIPNKLPGKVCSTQQKYTIENVEYVNINTCSCSTEGCNDVLGPVSNGSTPGASGLKCYQCFPCKNEGVVVTCPSTTLNCYYFTGVNTSSNSSEKLKGKGCAGSELVPFPLVKKKCLPFSSYVINGTSFSDVEACGCASSKCNDELKSKLECYECKGCRGKGDLVSCAKGFNNCFVMSGKLGLFEVSSKGCYADLPQVIQPVCTKYPTIDFSGRTIKRAKACVCPTSKCNAVKIPSGSLFNTAALVFQTNAVLGLSILMTYFKNM